RPFSSRVSFAALTQFNSVADRHYTGQTLFEPLKASFPDAWLLASVINCDRPELAQLPAHLLGNVVVVTDLSAARAMQQAEHQLNSTADPAPLPTTTQQAELPDPDAPLTTATHHAEAAILSRKTELPELRQQAEALNRRITETERHLAELRDRLSIHDS